MSKPYVFIGSASEDRKIVNLIAGIIGGVSNAYAWPYAFGSGKSTLANLQGEVQKADFAIFVANGNDLTVSRGTEKLAVRDNIVFEIGLFFGAVGSDRTFVLCEEGAEPDFPSDLNGIVYKKYQAGNPDNLMTRLASACEDIATEIRRLHFRDCRNHRRYPSSLSWGGVERIALVADAALAVSQPRLSFGKQVRELIRSEATIPTKYFYCTDEGAQIWNELCRLPTYTYHSNSIELISRRARDIAREIIKHLDWPFVDFISLGSGDGEKDAVLLSQLQNVTKPVHSDRHRYYPIDFSDQLLVDCVNRVANIAEPSLLMIKAILGDFTALPDLRFVYENSPNPNVFSILGNTFGNTDEGRIINSLRNAMYDGDFLILEVNIDKADAEVNDRLVKTPLNMRQTYIPLKMCGVIPNDEQIGWRPAEASAVPDTATRRNFYMDLKVDGIEKKEVVLFDAHHYNFAELQNWLKDKLDIEILLKDENGNVGLILGQKRGGEAGPH